MRDNIFGELTFNTGWNKKESITIWGKTYEVSVRISSKEDELPNKEQKASYTRYRENLIDISDKTEGLFLNFIELNSDEILEQLGISNIENPFELVKPEEVLFFQNGNFAIIFDIAWSDLNLAILYSKNSIILDYDYILESEY